MVGVARLATDANPVALAPRTLTALATAMFRCGLDPTPLRSDALVARPNDFLIAFPLGVGCFEQNWRAESLTSFRVALAIRPDHGPILNNMALALRDAGDEAGALACYRAALRRDSTFAPAHVGLGSALYKQGKVDAAIACYREALKHDLKHLMAYVNLGTLLGGRGDLDGAAACFEAALRINPTFLPARRYFEFARMFQAERYAAEGRITPPPRSVAVRQAKP